MTYNLCIVERFTITIQRYEKFAEFTIFDVEKNTDPPDQEPIRSHE